jgi:hypothetical protein
MMVVVVVVVAMTTTMIHHASSLRDKYINAGAQAPVKILQKFSHYSPPQFWNSENPLYKNCLILPSISSPQ